MDTLGAVVKPENLFVVFLKDGTKQFALAEDEAALPFKADDISFAANLTEIESLVTEMKEVQSLHVNDSGNDLILEKKS